MQYDCRIEGLEMRCRITADRGLTGVVFCASGMAPLRVVRGGELRRSLGGYLEVALPDLAAGQAHELVLAYDGGYRPANRAWMPLGPYLRHAGGLVQLPPTPAGRRVAHRPVAAPKGLPLVPQPQGWQPEPGVLQSTGFICDDPALRAVADLAERQGMRFRGSTPVQLIETDLPQEAYALQIRPDGVTLEAGSRSGRFYAGITLLTLLQQGALPCGRITDAPRFAWRGQHLDCARHFYAPQSICALLDLMALLKLNRFHWHFADDEAFRLQVTCLPELWQKTARRGEGRLLPGLFAGAPDQGGSYALAEVEQIIRHARQLNIEILPEIEFPAHALCLTTLYPETRDPLDSGSERSVQGYARNVLNPAMPRSWEIARALVTEIGQIFPFGHIHIGCDELPNGAWAQSPAGQALMQEHGLATPQDLLGWSAAKLARYATAQGLRPAAWEEAAKAAPGIGTAALLFSWTGQGAGLEAARAGYDVVMTPAQHVYLDMAQSDDPEEWGANWAGYVSLADTVDWDPVPDPAVTDRIIGVQAAFWSEFTTRDAQLWPMLMPRLLGIASICWQTARPEAAELEALATLYQTSSNGRISLRKY